MGGRRLAYTWKWHLPASPERVWPLVSDTHGFNRAVGVGPWTFTETPNPQGGSRRQGSFKSLGRRITWDENPFHWVGGKEFSVLRVYHNGPFREVRSTVELEPNDGGTSLTYRIEAEVRSLLWHIPARYYLGVSTYRNFNRAFRNVARHLAGEAPTPYPHQTSDTKSRAEARLSAGESSLVQAGFEPGVAERFAGFIRTSSDDDCGRIRPFRLADSWSEGRESVLRLCLHATRLGLLDLTWDLMCPLCRGAKGQVSSLSDLRSQAHCSSCNIRFDANFDRSVEVTFRPSERVRRIEQNSYCVGGPGNTPHVIVQQTIAPDGRFTVPVDLSPGVYRLRGPQIKGAALIEVDQSHPGPGDIRFSCSVGELTPLRAAVAPGRTALSVENTREQELLVILEATQWPDDAVTAAFVTTLQDFRDLFSSEALAPEEHFEVRYLCFMFTDLRSSTTLYRVQGDALAYAMVRDHFRVIFDSVAEHSGAVVKTIGDAVMAVFREPGDAVAMGLDAHRSLSEKGSSSPDIVLKIGVYAGPCIAVNLNDRLDYFGTTVNAAVRLQGESLGGDIVMGAALLDDPGVQEALRGPGIHTEPIRVQLKGFEKDFEAVRVTWQEPPD